MAADSLHMSMTLSEYFALDEAHETKYEYIDGKVYDQAGRTVAHSQIAMNMYQLIDQGLHASSERCHRRVFNSDVCVQIGKNYVYPDLTVSCDPDDGRDDVTLIRSPQLVVEVLSPSTELKDQREKLALYQQHPTIKEYLLIGTKRPVAEVYTRGNGQWNYHRYQGGEVIKLDSIGTTITMLEVYQRTSILSETD